MVRNEHKSKKIAIKRALVDNGIAGLVKWLNSRDGVCTTDSCEGGGIESGSDIPYVLFHVKDRMQFQRIEFALSVASFSVEEPEWIWINTNTKYRSGFCYSVSHTLYFSSLKTVKVVLKSLKKQEKQK